MKKNTKTKDKEREALTSSANANNLSGQAPTDMEKVIAEIYVLLEEIKQHKNTLKKKGIL